MPNNDPDIEALLGPVKDKEARKYKELGELHDLLLRACPPDNKGDRSIPILAKHLGMSSWGIFKWIKQSRIPPRQASRIASLSEGRVRLEEFTPFIFR